MSTANVKNISRRLQRLRDALADGEEHSTRELIIDAGICAVNTAIHELRKSGVPVNCRRHSNGRYYYRMETQQ